MRPNVITSDADAAQLRNLLASIPRDTAFGFDSSSEDNASDGDDTPADSNIDSIREMVRLTLARMTREVSDAVAVSTSSARAIESSMHTVSSSAPPVPTPLSPRALARAGLARILALPSLPSTPTSDALPLTCSTVAPLISSSSCD